MSRNRILIVEDDAAVRVALGRACRSAGYDVEFATDLAEGLAKVNSQQVVLLDLDLPGGSGTKILRRIREVSKSIKTAVYSGLSDGEAVVDASGERPDGYFRKPADLDRLFEWIGAVIEPA